MAADSSTSNLEMDSGTQQPPEQRRGFPVQSSTIHSTGSIYSAFGDYEREARQRKYMIAECEDVIAGLEKTLAEHQKECTELKAESERLHMESNAAAATYEKRVKEKALIQNAYQKLSSEMSRLQEDTKERRAKLKKIEMLRKEKLEYSAKKAAQHMDLYKRIPSVANVFDLKRSTEQLKIRLSEATKVLQEKGEDEKLLKAQREEAWKTFVGKCVKIAEGGTALREKVQRHAKLQAECERSKRREQEMSKVSGKSSNESIFQKNLPSTTIPRHFATIPSLSQSFSQKMTNIVVPTVKRPSSFRQMDRFLKRSDSLSPYGKRLAEVMDSNKSMRPPESPGRSEALSELRLRLQKKQSVFIPPMPRMSVAGLSHGFTSPSNISIEMTNVGQLEYDESSLMEVSEKTDDAVHLNEPSQREVQMTVSENEARSQQQKESTALMAERIDNLEGNHGHNDGSNPPEAPNMGDIGSGGFDMNFFGGTSTSGASSPFMGQNGFFGSPPPTNQSDRPGGDFNFMNW